MGPYGQARGTPLKFRLRLTWILASLPLDAARNTKGLVVITGCGHPSIGTILNVARRISNNRIYSICGGLHFPIGGGRGNRAGIQLQTIVGTGKSVCKRITDRISSWCSGTFALNSLCIRLIAWSLESCADRSTLSGPALFIVSIVWVRWSFHPSTQSLRSSVGLKDVVYTCWRKSFRGSRRCTEKNR